jgi:uncharacterized membrane protein YedE/YeeE
MSSLFALVDHPAAALLGGALIGVAASVLWLGLGRIAGVSGILGGALRPGQPGDERTWRVAFLVGLPLGAAITALAGFAPRVEGIASAPVLVAAGLLVGFGTRLGNGCTSGHGVCGLPRGSLRSLVATLTFVATGMLTVFVVRHGIGG